MNLYISDLHFGHSNVINFDHRPFKDVEEMDRCLIDLWNYRISVDDHVYIVGDFMYRSGKDAVWYLRQLKGHKHLVLGNHDTKLVEDNKAMSYFEEVDKLMFINDSYEKSNIQICLCHYPMIEWDKSRHGSWHIYGHIHGNRDETYEIMKNIDRTLNAGACINNYTPASFRELVENNRKFQMM